VVVIEDTEERRIGDAYGFRAAEGVVAPEAVGLTGEALVVHEVEPADALFAKCEVGVVANHAKGSGLAGQAGTIGERIVIGAGNTLAVDDAVDAVLIAAVAAGPISGVEVEAELAGVAHVELDRVVCAVGDVLLITG
jgi:hypothetical protein